MRIDIVKPVLFVRPLFTLLLQKSRQQNFRLQIIKKIIQAISYSEFKDKMANSVDLDEAARYDPPLFANSDIFVSGT